MNFIQAIQELIGIEALTPAKINKFYSKVLKERAAAVYLTKSIQCTKPLQHMKLAIGRCLNHG